MIVAAQKPFSEIASYIKGYKKILIAACGTCVTVCMSGGEKEAGTLAALIEAENAGVNDCGGDGGCNSGNESGLEIKVVAPKRQCDTEFLDEIAEDVKNADVILSMACGAGVQYMAERFAGKLVMPAVNTRFIGVTRDVGVWTEMCQGCGECLLEKTGGICPVTRCSKSNLNGPCGGSSHGKCEIDPGMDCGWQLIYDRLKLLGKLDRLYEISETRDWRTSRDGGPRRQEYNKVRLDQ